MKRKPVDYLGGLLLFWILFLVFANFTHNNLASNPPTLKEWSQFVFVILFIVMVWQGCVAVFTFMRCMLDKFCPYRATK
jgi:hypothetical protein